MDHPILGRTPKPRVKIVLIINDLDINICKSVLNMPKLISEIFLALSLLFLHVKAGASFTVDYTHGHTPKWLEELIAER